MKFAEHLSAHITPEWRKQYINYEEMKAMLYVAVEEAPSAESVEPAELSRHFTKFDEMFFSYCDKELLKINTFYSEKLAEATRKFTTLRSELISSSQQQKGKAKRKSDVPIRKMNDLKLAFSEFYLMLILLQNYQNLNYTGFRKILKKHDKLLSVDLGGKFHTEHVESAHFYNNKDIPRLINETETTVTQDLEGGDRQRAMKRLRVPPLGEQQSPWTTFKVGLFSGSFIVLIIAVVLSAIFQDGGGADLNTAFKLYRGPLLIVEFLFLIGVNVYFWRSSGVNHVLIFELDPRNHLSEQHLMEVAAILGVVWSLSMLSFLYSASLSIPPYINPLSLTAIFILFTVNPIHTFRHEARFWSLKVIGRMVMAPFYHVGFADFWLADQLNSLVTVLLDLHFLLCFYLNSGDWLKAASIDIHSCGGSEMYLLTRAVVNCIPAWIRFAQCLRRYYDSGEAFPHLVNAGKYSTTFFVVFFAYQRAINKEDYPNDWDSPYLWWWLVASTVSSVYAYTWDIKMDWGLFDSKAGENTFLREEIVYSSMSFYYFAIIEDLLLRFSWVFTFALEYNQICTNKDLINSVTAILEVFRRFVWNFFRLENEHLNNCGKFRAVRDISVAPMDSSDQTQIIRMMDEENGVTNRKTQRKTVKKPVKEEKKALLNRENITEMGLSITPKK